MFFFSSQTSNRSTYIISDAPIHGHKCLKLMKKDKHPKLQNVTQGENIKLDGTYSSLSWVLSAQGLWVRRKQHQKIMRYDIVQIMTVTGIRCIKCLHCRSLSRSIVDSKQSPIVENPKQDAAEPLWETFHIYQQSPTGPLSGLAPQ